MAYRAFLPFWPEYARECLSRAERAWAFLERHPDTVPAGGFRNPPGIGGGEYGDPSGDVDERAWAAAELYKSTGRAYYDSVFVRYWVQHEPRWGWNVFQHHQQKASWAYATCRFPTQREHVDNYKRWLRQHIEEELLPRTEENVYRNGYRSDVPEWIGWGAFAQSSQYAWELLQAGKLLGESSYGDQALVNVEVQLGNNPQYRSYITGVGTVYPRNPLHHPSMFDGVAEPVPGLPVFGPHNQLNGDNPYFTAVRETFFPAGRQPEDPYPLLRRYVDSAQLVPMSEFTIQEIALATATYAALSSFNTPPVEAQIPLLEGSGPFMEKVGDFDQDGVVGFQDFAFFSEAFGSGIPWFDLDGNGTVNLHDFFLFADRFGK